MLSQSCGSETRYVKEDLQRFKPSISIGNKGNWSNSDCGMVVGPRLVWVFQIWLIYWGFLAQPSLVGADGKATQITNRYNHGLWTHNTWKHWALRAKTVSLDLETTATVNTGSPILDNERLENCCLHFCCNIQIVGSEIGILSTIPACGGVTAWGIFLQHSYSPAPTEHHDTVDPSIAANPVYPFMTTIISLWLLAAG